ncbi:hypothetical protein [Flavivirga rizhaonensis]|uniref:Uncharacterized protein n=1 Tax=Flavivirga rizhaonensis TaxID=2559571 RepID=A0A4S1E2E7_9FLAO|nr:hypothetical protein [Flavivirga rizhaonensis]TGV04816.1 hypothetical protein EM932_01470 [Flavivirga rizhaonensis]
MEANYDYYKIDIADIWKFEQFSFLKGKSSEKYARELFQRIEDLIIIKGEPFLTTEDYDNRDDEYRRIFNSYIKDFRETIGDFKSRYSLSYFFTNDYCFHYGRSIIIDRSCDGFDFWFILKLKQYDSKLSEIKKFLDFQLETNFTNEVSEFVNFLKISIRQYQDEFHEKRVVETVNDYIDSRDDKKLSSNKNKRKISGNIYSLYLRILKTDPKFFRKPDTIKSYYEAFNKLKKEKFISGNTSLDNFKEIFRSKEISKNKRIVWIGTNKELQWFMKYLVRDSKKVVDLKKDIWLVTIRCFVKSENKEFTVEQLRDAKGKATHRKLLLESILSLL